MPIEFSGFFEKRLQETLQTTILKLIELIPTVKPKHLMNYIQAIKGLISIFPNEEITVEICENALGDEEPVKASIEIEDDFSEIVENLKNLFSEMTEKIAEDEQ